MQGIYQVKNKTNGKSYIGQSIDIHIRWSEHINSAFNKGHQSHEYPLPRAIRKHGVEAFEFLVLEETVKERLTEKETYWYKQIEPEYNQILPKDSSGGTAKEYTR